MTLMQEPGTARGSAQCAHHSSRQLDDPRGASSSERWQSGRVSSRRYLSGLVTGTGTSYRASGRQPSVHWPSFATACVDALRPAPLAHKAA
jgi:hypothetical protein